MKFSWMLLLLAGAALAANATQQSRQPSPPPGAPATAPLSTVTIAPSKSVLPPPSSLAGQPGYLSPGQASALALKIWQTESRVRDLLSQVKPDAWKTSAASRAAGRLTLKSLEDQLDSLEKARAQFAAEPNSTYKGFSLYAAISNALPPLGETARLVTRVEDPTLGGYFLKAWTNLFAVNGALDPYLKFLLLHHDQIVEEYESDVTHCQAELSAAQKSHSTSVKRIRTRRLGRPIR